MFTNLGSYNVRCHTAVSAYNYGPSHLSQFHKKITNFSPGKYTKRYISKEIKKKLNNTHRLSSKASTYTK